MTKLRISTSLLDGRFIEKDSTMSDAPYDKAIEESAKVTGKALDLVKDSAQPIANIYGLLIGDQIGAARHRRLDAITRKTKKILHERDLAETAELAEQIAIPLLEAAQGEPREEIKIFGRCCWRTPWILHGAMIFAPEFIAALKELHPVDALVLHLLKNLNGYVTSGAAAEAANLRPASTVVSLTNLVNRGCALRATNGTYAISDFGKELLLACEP